MSTITAGPPATLPVCPEAFPPDLAERRQWVCWQWAHRPTARKPWTKPPINPRSGMKASVTDPTTWGDLASALATARRNNLPGVGFVLTPDDPYTVVDLDGCRDPRTGVLSPEAAAIVAALDSYADASPSGTGVHVLVEGHLPSGTGRRHGEIEVYSAGRYITMTGHRLPNSPVDIQPRQEALEQLYIEIFGFQGHHDAAANGQRPPDSPAMSDAEVIARARDARNGATFDALYNGDTSAHGGDDSAADLALLSLLAFWTQDPDQLDRLFRRSGLYRAKWERADYRQPTIAKALDRTEVYAPGASVTVNGRGPSPDGNACAPGIAPLDWPELDAAALSGLPGDVVDALDPHTEGDRVAVLVNFLIMFGSAVGPTPHALVGDRRHHANEFAALVGDTSKGRKGTAHDTPLAIVGAADPGWQSRAMGGLSSGEGLIWAIRDPISTTKKGEEMLTDPGVADKRLLAVEEEFSAVCRVATRDGNTLSETIRRAWDGKPLGNLTKNSPARCLTPHVSMLAHVTGTELLRVIDSTDAANGFGNRFLWVCVHRSKLLPEGGRLPADEREELVARTREALLAARKAGEVRRDAEAKAIWAEIYPALSTAGVGLFGAMTDRAEAHVLRLSLLYALTDGTRLITADHLTAALALWDYCAASARRIFGNALGDPVADRIVAALRASGPLDRTQISEVFGRHAKAAQLDRGLATLLTAGKVRTWREETGGRSRTWWAAT